MRVTRLCLPMALLMGLSMARAEVSANKLAQALGVAGLKVKLEPKLRPQQVHQDYVLTDAAGNEVATVILAPAASFADWQQLPGYQPIQGLGQEAYARPELDQLCGRSRAAAACITLMPGAFAAGKKPSLDQRKAALLSLF